MRVCVKISSWVRGGAVGSGTAVQAGRSQVRLPMVSLEFSIDIILPAVLGLWGRLNPNRSESGKGGLCVGLKT
jgi:hypothetical protein